MATKAKSKPPRENAIERDPRFARFAECYVLCKGVGYRAAKMAGYPADYAKSHAHQLVARLKLKAGPVLRASGIDEVHISLRLKKLLDAEEPKWNAKTKKWDTFGNGTVQLGALQLAAKLLDMEPPRRLAGDGPGGSIPVTIKTSVSLPAPNPPTAGQ